MVRRIDIEADDIADLDLEPWVARDLEGLDLMRLEAVLLQDVVHRGVDHAQLLRQRPHRPVTGMLRRRRHRQRNQRLHLLLGDWLLPRRTGRVPKKPVNALGEKTVPPAPNRRLRHARPLHGLGQPAARSKLQDNAGPPDMLLKAPWIADDAFEALALLVRKSDLLPCRFPTHMPVSCFFRGTHDSGSRRML